MLKLGMAIRQKNWRIQDSGFYADSLCCVFGSGFLGAHSNFSQHKYYGPVRNFQFLQLVGNVDLMFLLWILYGKRILG